MSDSIDHIEELLEPTLRADVPDEVQQRLRSQLADFRANLAEKRRPPVAWLTESRRTVWLGLGATAAAVALMASLTTILLRPQVSFADVVAAIQQFPWVHVSATDVDGETRELWYSPRDDLSASRSKDWIEYRDHKLRVYYSYDVREGILYRVPEHTAMRSDYYAVFAEALQTVLRGERPTEKPFDSLKFLGREGANMELLEQKLKRVEEGGQQWLDYRLAIRSSQIPDPVYLTCRVDPTTMLPQFCRMEGKWQGKPASSEQRIEYPQRGPANVYELGVPQSAKLVDRIPSNDIVRILDTIRAGRQRMDDYRAIVVGRIDGADYAWWVNDRPMMFYRKGNKTRADDARWRGDFPMVEKPADNADMEKWWRKRAKDFVYCPFYITHGPTVYDIKTGVTTDANGANRLEIESVDKRDTNQLPGETFPPYYSRSPEFVCRPPLGIPQQAFEPVIDMKPGQGPVGSILLRATKSGRVPEAKNPNAKEFPRQPDVYLFWLDPKRDYAVTRWDMMGAGKAANEVVLGSTIIEELKQSPRGVWYASRFRSKAVPPVEHDEVYNVYIDFDVDLPDTLFEPPAVGRVIR